MNAEPILTSPHDLREVTAAAQQSAIRAYRDGFTTALVAVSNAALNAPGPAYAVVVESIEAAKKRLEEDLDVALDGERIYW